VILLLLALLLTGGMLALVDSGTADASSSEDVADDVAQGERIFQANCATCHGLDATGNDVGPSLGGVGAASVDFQMATGRMPMRINGPQAESGNPSFSTEEISQVAAFVASLGPGPSIPSAEQVDPELGDPANGMQIFRTNCAMCHNAVGAGGALSEGRFAPSLFESTPTEIYEAMQTGPQSMPVFNDANIDPDAKRDVISYLMAQRDTSVGGISLGSIGPVTEGVWVWIVGMGLLVGISVWIGAKSS
jgi:ubiquinol-cytochrome c reductase cytochrome c subunit